MVGFGAVRGGIAFWFGSADPLATGNCGAGGRTLASGEVDFVFSSGNPFCPALDCPGTRIRIEPLADGPLARSFAPFWAVAWPGSLSLILLGPTEGAGSVPSFVYLDGRFLMMSWK